jgi:hypothetical protein
MIGAIVIYCLSIFLFGLAAQRATSGSVRIWDRSSPTVEWSPIRTIACVTSSLLLFSWLGSIMFPSPIIEQTHYRVLSLTKSMLASTTSFVATADAPPTLSRDVPLPTMPPTAVLAANEPVAAKIDSGKLNNAITELDQLLKEFVERAPYRDARFFHSSMPMLGSEDILRDRFVRAIMNGTLFAGAIV